MKQQEQQNNIGRSKKENKRKQNEMKRKTKQLDQKQTKKIMRNKIQITIYEKVLSHLINTILILHFSTLRNKSQDKMFTTYKLTFFGVW